MHNILRQIIQKKHKDINKEKRLISISDLRKRASSAEFESNFKSRLLNVPYPNIAIIAEIKLASPTISSLGSRSEIIKRAIAYEQAKADAISLITEKHFFKGNITFISQLKIKVNLPILQKDFVIDAYQIYRAKIIGSDALLLMARLVDRKTLKKFVSLSQQLGIEPVVEINNEEDLEKAVTTTTSFIAVNARDLRTFAIDIDKACDLIKKIPDSFIKLGFSGINSSSEVEKYKEARVKGVLIGTGLMKAENIYDFIDSLRNV